MLVRCRAQTFTLWRGWTSAMLTERLEVRPAAAADRDTFVALFGDPEFMVFSGALTPTQAQSRFDHMLAMIQHCVFAKQAIFETATGQIIGYVGVDRANFEGEERLEFGWRLVRSARGRGYATEAANALLGLADRTSGAEILAFVDPRNTASQRVAKKVGFVYSRQGSIDGYIDNVYIRGLGTQPTPATAPGELAIAVATADDVRELADLRASWVAQTEIAADDLFQQDFQAWFEAESKDRVFWTARVDGRALGMVNVLVFDRMPSPNQEPERWGYLGNMFVNDRVRNRSIGTQLLNALVEWADEHDLVRLVLNPSERSVPLYSRNGFTDRSGLLVRPLNGSI